MMHTYCSTRRKEPRKKMESNPILSLIDLDGYDFDETIPIFIEKNLPNTGENNSSSKADICEKLNWVDNSEKIQEGKETNNTAPTEETISNKILVDDTLLEEDTILQSKTKAQEENSIDPSKKYGLKQDFCIAEMKKAIEERKDAEMKTKIEQLKKAEETAIDVIKKEEENRYTVLKKKFQNLENKLKKKEEELEASKNLSKLKQTKFLEDLENLTKEYAEKFKDMHTALLEKEDIISKLKNKSKDNGTGDSSNIITEKDDRNKYVHSEGETIGTEKSDVENKTGEEKDPPFANGKGITIQKRDNRKCFNCNIKGHIAKDCPTENKSKWCNFCSKDNHDTEDCWSTRRNFEKQSKKYINGQKTDHADDVCTVCKKKGHLAKDCRHRYNQKGERKENSNEKTSSGKSNKELDSRKKVLKCDICGRKGHNTDNCWHRKDKEKIDGATTKLTDDSKKDSKNDQDLMSLLHMVQQWHQQRTQ